MTDYSHILPADDAEAQKLLSSCGVVYGGGKPYDLASIVIDDDAVRLSVHTVYTSNDATPMDEWHGLVLRYSLPRGTDAVWLRESLAGGDNGSNTVGTFTEDAREASEALSYSFETEDVPKSDLEVWEAETWLGSANMNIKKLAEALRETSPEEALAEAEYDGKIVIEGGIEAMREAFAQVFEEAKDLDVG